MKTILFTNARDENHILEWAVHHLNLGFDMIYIFDHKSKVPIKDIINNQAVTISRIDTDINKVSLMLQASNIAKGYGYDWLMYLDADEFLVLNEDNNIKEFLNKYQNYDQIGINELLFGTNHIDDEIDGTILEMYTKSESKLDKHIKCIVKVNTIIPKVTLPHYFNIKDMRKSVAVTRQPLCIKFPSWFYINKTYKEVNAYIAHYYYQSYNVYLRRKISLPRDDHNSYRALESKQIVHTRYNDIENVDVRNKYNEQNKLLIKKYESIK